MIGDGFWKALGTILDRFGGQVGSNLEPKSVQNRLKKAIKNQMHFVIDFLIDLGL